MKAASFAIIIPAHNEERGIIGTLSSLKACCGEADIVVVADNCTDGTAKAATGMGVRVIERNNSDYKGKQHALAFVFPILLSEEYQYFAIVDADTLVEKNFLSALRKGFSDGFHVLQVHYALMESTSGYPQRLLEIGFTGVNLVKPLGRKFWGLSCGLLGNGFALDRETLLKVPFDVSSIAEDVDYHVKLVMNNVTVTFIDDTTIRAYAPHSVEGITTQRARWIGGRFYILKTQGLNLFRMLLKGNVRLLEPLLDILMPSLPLQFIAAFLLLLMPFYAVKMYACFALLAISLYVFVSVYFHRGGWKDWAALGLAPFYVIWSLKIIPRIFSAARKSLWNRTERD